MNWHLGIAGTPSELKPLQMNSENPHSADSLFPLRVAWQTGRQAFLQNQLPALVLWLFGLALVLGYYFLPFVQQGLDFVGSLKSHWGWKFSAASTALFGGTLPVFISWVFGRSRRLDPLPNLRNSAYVVSNALFWSAKGVEIDFLYRLQAALLGSKLNWQTVITKTAIDQLLYVPAFGLVNVVLFYLWRDAGYSFKRFRRTLGPSWYRARILPVLLSNWVIWIPAVALIYCLPVSLQLPIQNLILCFWVLVLTFFTDRPSGRPHPAGPQKVNWVECESRSNNGALRETPNTGCATTTLRRKTQKVWTI